jgi:N-acyl homoserine lactone hydrolase
LDLTPIGLLSNRPSCAINSFDTSCPRDGESRWATSGMNEITPYTDVDDDWYFDAWLAQLGLRADDIDKVVLSHLHLDHAGNAAMFDNGHTQIYCNGAERKYAFGFDGAFEGGYIKSDYASLAMSSVRGDVEIADGVSVLEVRTCR